MFDRFDQFNLYYNPLKINNLQHYFLSYYKTLISQVLLPYVSFYCLFLQNHQLKIRTIRPLDAMYKYVALSDFSLILINIVSQVIKHKYCHLSFHINVEIKQYCEQFLNLQLNTSALLKQHECTSIIKNRNYFPITPVQRQITFVTLISLLVLGCFQNDTITI